MEEKEEMGKQMIKHCGGLPLAIKVLGGLLAAQHSLTEWKRVFKHINSHIVGGISFNDRNINSVYHMLYLSFEELPNYLKHCFLYLAHFPEDYIIIVEELAYYWAADGIPRPKYYNGATIRDVADGYIGELVQRNMVISKQDELTSRFETCRLHDMMREVCLLKAEDENFLHIVHNTSTTNSIKMNDKVKLELGNLVNLETLEKFSTKNSSVKDLHQMTRLTTLSIRYNGGGCTIETLSSSLSELTHLETLEIHADKKDEKGFVLVCDHLKRLVLWIYMPKLPDEQHFLSHLTSIVLANCLLEKDPMPILEKLLQLQVVELNYNSFCGRRMVCSAGGFRKLQKLNLLSLNEWEEWIVEEGSMPLLQSLNIENCEKLKKLFDVLPVLEKLLQLKSVSLENLSYESKWVCSSGGFPQLQMLSLSILSEWEEWIVEKDSMPLLHDLSIKWCPKLKQLPDGLIFLTSLKCLDIYTHWKDWKKEKEWREILSEGGKDYYKVQHIPLLQFRIW